MLLYRVRFGATAKNRGLFKTTDGGKTWTNILYVDEKPVALKC
jgi:photosystem II stability/assembly factor-like uncharacterized protein